MRPSPTALGERRIRRFGTCTTAPCGAKIGDRRGGLSGTLLTIV
jgi:hypothetical protein